MDRVVAVMADTARLPIRMTDVGRSVAAYRSIASMINERGKLVRTSVAKQLDAASTVTAPGGTGTQPAKH